MPSLELAVRQAAWRLRSGKTEQETRAEMSILYAAAGAAFLDDVMRRSVSQFTAASRWKGGPPDVPLRDVVPPLDRTTVDPEAHVIIRIDRPGQDPSYADLVVPVSPDSVYGDFVSQADIAATEFSVTGRADGAIVFWTDFYVAW